VIPETEEKRTKLNTDRNIYKNIFEVLMAVKTLTLVFWVITPCGPVS
jgi:hypothetical protein